MITLLNKTLRLFFSKQKIWELKNKHHIPSMEWSLMNIKKLGYMPVFAVDAGAFDGEWTKMFKTIFPLANVLMIEPQRDKTDVLKTITGVLPGTHFHIGLLGSASGKEVVFHVNATVSSVLEEYKPNTFKKESLYLETLDDIILKTGNNFKLPDFIKLDVQGYELEVLKGASKIMESLQFILCEVSLIEINKNSPLIAEVIRFMDERGFMTYDICSFIRRPLDRALWQTDILFIRKTHPLIQNKYWD